MTRIRLATWNVNSIKVRLPQVLDWLERARVDALVMQETKSTDEAFPREAFEAAGFDVLFSGQKTYNGVALCTRRDALSVSEPECGIPGYADPQRRFISALLTPKAGGESLRFCGAYFPNGAAVGASKYLYKLDWIAALERHLKAQLERTPRLVLGGDFNIAPEDADLWDPELWRGRILCSAAERSAYRRLLDLGLADAFRRFPQAPETFSWWDYRQSGFEKNRGLRIDLLLVSEALLPRLAASAIDAGPRANPQPSDHAPATADIDL